MKKICLISAYVVFLLSSQLFLNASDSSESDEYRYLDQIALEAETDKSSAFHNYTKVYAKYLSKYRNKPIKFLEIGIYHGDSVKLWEKYFTKADLHFIDINSDQILYHSDRSHYHYVDQTDKKGLVEFAKNVRRGFDVIIDDGGHRMDQIINSFQALFPFLNSGGMYIIEDLHTSYWSSYGSYGTTQHPQAGPWTAIQFLKGLIDDLNYTSARSCCADAEKVPLELEEVLNDYQKDIESIHFYKSLCIIIKN